MARLVKISDVSWCQPLIDRNNDFRLFNVERNVAKICNIHDQQKRLMSVVFEHGNSLDQEIFTITSGIEMRMSADSQRIIANYKEKFPRSYYVVKVIDVENPAYTDEIIFDVDGEYIDGGPSRAKHYNLERSPKASRDKKVDFKNKYGSLYCEICGFSFSQKYEDADDFIECHHLMPLSRLKKKTVIRLNDLALLCSNCHRVAHIHLRKEAGALSIQELRRMILRHSESLTSTSS